MIQLYNVTRQFGSVKALQNVTLRVKKGEFILLSSPSGAGKISIFAAERPDDGQIILAGRNIGVVFQDFKLLRRRSALQNVAVALEIRGMPAKKIKQRCLLADLVRWLCSRHRPNQGFVKCSAFIGQLAVR